MLYFQRVKSFGSGNRQVAQLAISYLLIFKQNRDAGIAFRLKNLRKETVGVQSVIDFSPCSKCSQRRYGLQFSDPRFELCARCGLI